MAKQALLDVLEKSIGKYVQNLDAQSLNVALWSGKIELNRLELNLGAVNDALDRQAAQFPAMALPFRVMDGHFEHFEIQVPWARLWSQSVLFRASGLHVTVAPQDRTAAVDHLYQVFESEEIRAAQVIKSRQMAIQSAEDSRQQAQTFRRLAETDLEFKSSANTKAAVEESAKSTTFVERLVRRILENLQVDIEDVHITLRGDQGSAGIRLEAFQLATTDAQGNRTFVDRTTNTKNQASAKDNSFLYKALIMTGLGIYMDPPPSSTSASGNRLVSIQEIKSPAVATNRLPDHSYLLAPLSLEARLRQADSNVCVDFPKYDLSSELSSLSLLLSRAQLELAQHIGQQVSPAHDRARPLFPEYRPLVRVTRGNARQWWLYAKRCIGRMSGRTSWVEFFRVFQSRKKYLALYRRHAHSTSCSWLSPLEPKELDQLENIEMDRSISVEGIMAWRTIADAQVDKERERAANQKKAAAAATSMFTSLFGSSTSQKGKGPQEEPAVTLTTEELKELEALALQQSAEADLSKESRLCQIQFAMKSFSIQLSWDRPVTLLEMGTVSLSLDAKNDGAFDFASSLASLEIQDRVTPKTLFPYVVRNQQGRELKGSSDDASEAFSLHVARSKKGDQQVQLKLNTFELVASPVLLIEMKRFFSLSERSSATIQSNVLLSQSISGSVDLFYDASQGKAHADGDTTKVDSKADIKKALAGSTTVTDLSHALVDAWKFKTETSSDLVVDFDVQAPIIIIPEKCNDPRANVLVFDLGHLRLKYGTIGSSNTVEEWFRSHPKDAEGSTDSVLDFGSLAISNLTFVVSNADSFRGMISRYDEAADHRVKNAVVEPISLSVDFGVESHVAEDTPRICIMCDVPSVAMGLLPSQVSCIATVYGSWMKTFGSLKPSIVESDRSLSSVYSPTDDDWEKLEISANKQGPGPRDAGTKYIKFYASMRLRRLSAKVATESGHGMEAHLVSTSIEATSFSDTGAEASLSMGWFWILDRLQHDDFPRRQRLIAHSNLPGDGDRLAANDYEILEVLRKDGVFDDRFEGSSDLAHISYVAIPDGATHSENIFDFNPAEIDSSRVDSFLDARFSSLHVNWNPKAMRNIIDTLQNFLSSLQDSVEIGTLIAPRLSEAGRPRSDSDIVPSKLVFENKVESRKMLIRATMGTFQVSLNSAKDDLPVFIITMASTNVGVLMEGGNMRVSLVLGDVNIATPSFGRTHDMYRTILGLSPGTTDSLLSVSYFDGTVAMKSKSISVTQDSACSAYGSVHLSPMRLVYVQAQVLALVEYATEGILGALTTQAAANAAAAASGMAASKSKRFFQVEAVGFDLLLPQAAYRAKFLSIHAGTLLVDYNMDSNSGADAQLGLSDVSIRDGDGRQMQEKSIRMEIKAKLPPEGVGSLEDQAMRVDVSLSAASFILTKQQYGQILDSLDENIGDRDLYLRDDDAPTIASDELTATSEGLALKSGFSHSGVENVEITRRMILSMKIDVLALEIRGASLDDRIVRLAAVDSVIAMSLLPDENKMFSQVSLQDLVCEDVRSEAFDREHRSLLYQPHKASDTEKLDVFVITYEVRTLEKSSSIDLNIGSPRLVFIPDAVAAVLDFVSPVRESQPLPRDTALPQAQPEIVRLDSPDESEGIEASLESGDNQVSSLTVSVRTSRCSVLLVDLGSGVILEDRASKLGSVDSVSEAVVFEGLFDAKATLDNDTQSGALIVGSLLFHGDDLEVYTAFGAELYSPVQILDQSRITIDVQSKSSHVSRAIEIRCATLCPLDITCSMRNVALLNAIMSSLKDSFESKKGLDGPNGDNLLTKQETDRLERLAAELERDDADRSVHSSESGLSVDVASIGVKGKGDMTSISSFISVKFTTPETRVTMINDLQGLDEALLRITIRNSCSELRLRDGEKLGGGPPLTLFDFNSNSTILAEYFDTAANLWSKLLVKPWEVNLKGGRGASRRFNSSRPSTTVDIECFPCDLTFSEQFLMSIASASRMWSMYSNATSSALGLDVRDGDQSNRLAASVARTFVSSLPYAIENHCGLDLHFMIEKERTDRKQFCGSGTMEYFRFEPPVIHGKAGKRQYGQDTTFEKAVQILIANEVLQVRNIDSSIGKSTIAHKLASGIVIMLDISKESKTIVIHVSSGVDIRNPTCLPFVVSLVKDGRGHPIGCCRASTEASVSPGAALTQSVKLSRKSNRFGIPCSLLDTFWSEWEKAEGANLSILVAPQLGGPHGSSRLEGQINLSIDRRRFFNRNSENGSAPLKFDVTCRSRSPNDSKLASASEELDPLVFHVNVNMKLIDSSYPAIEVVLEPRAIVKNDFPISITIQSPMPHLFTSSTNPSGVRKSDFFDLEPNAHMEAFTPGPSIAVSMRCTDSPVGGSAAGFLEHEWIDLPLVSEFKLPEPLQLSLQSSRRGLDEASRQASIEFFVAEGRHGLAQLEHLGSFPSTKGGPIKGMVDVPAATMDPSMAWRTFYFTLRNFGIDHTGDVLFEVVEAQVERALAASTKRRPSAVTRSSPLGAYNTKRFAGRVTLLPSSNVALRLLHLTMDGEEGFRKTLPFSVEDISICDGGLGSTPLKWQDQSDSGYYSYRRLVSTHQSQIHIIPEYIVFNGVTDRRLRIRQPGGADVIIEAGRFVPLRTNGKTTATISVEILDDGGQTAPIRIDSLQIRLAIVKNRENLPIGSLAIQTVVGAQDSRLVVKIGDLKYGAGGGQPEPSTRTGSLFRSDFLRFRVQWTELRLTLNEARPVVQKSQAFVEYALDQIRQAGASDHKSRGVNRLTSGGSVSDDSWMRARERSSVDESNEGTTTDALCTIILQRFTIDWQRVFKDEDMPEPRTVRDLLRSPERSQLSVIFYSVQIKDERPHSPFPIIFDSSSEGISFLDLCVRFRGPLDSDLVKVDLFDLNLAHSNGISDKMIINTDEDFVWSAIDLGDRILAAAGEFSGVDLELKWDEAQAGYVVSISDKKLTNTYGETKYSPPKSDVMFDVKRARVSPFTFVVSFKRSPEADRYKKARGRFSNLMNYFTRHLKFTIDRAELTFARYETTNVKGPADRLFELLSTVYLSRMKLKIVTILTAASFQDWKFLAARDAGDDEFVEGDILRVTGNLAGNTANYIFQKAGRGLGKGVSAMTSALGEGLESASSAVGAKSLGVGMNSIVSGVGDGVGSTVTGVGAGAGKVFKGAGQGAGHLFGGVTGGAMLMGKGIGKGIMTGDGRAMISGMTEGVTSVGTGVGRGVESVVTGAADGVLSVGHGLFSGVKSVSKGIGGAFTAFVGWCSCLACGCCGGGEEPVRQPPLISPLLSSTEEEEEQSS